MFFKRIAAPDWILKGQSSASFKAQMLPIFATFKVNSKEPLRWDEQVEMRQKEGLVHG